MDSNSVDTYAKDIEQNEKELIDKIDPNDLDYVKVKLPKVKKNRKNNDFY